MLGLGASGNLIKRRLAFGRQHSAANFEVDGSGVLLLIIVQRVDPVVGFVDAFDGHIGGLLGCLCAAFGDIGNLAQLFDLTRQPLGILLSFADACLGLTHTVL